ncbi:BON domain-containing protein [Candidatus Manganitrophus noduliformans]|uniref:BON domain-containing protein n=1 Tax=Candidatus Manganitrophus noduliformans TaxID=2606439 RepID=A0A7X6IBF3_9BACT|nr:BON domain-containing protein [Candidatus Manganitrophus noduliformans]NKE71349.1 BON domain-containing protein [Candidatus Manganitrophus noduliformans]
MNRIVWIIAVLFVLTGGPADAVEKEGPSVAPDNSEINQRDRGSSAVTPEVQGTDPADVETTRKIRKKITEDDSLSTTAKNVKIITQEGKVTLRGPVNSPAEKEKIAEKAEQIAGAGKVENELEVKSSTMR